MLYPVPAAAGGRSSRASWPLPPRALPAAKQANPRADRGAVPGRNGRASCSRHSATSARARAPPQGRRGAPSVAGSGWPRLPALRPPRPGSAPAPQGPAPPRARTHLDGLSLASRLPSTTAGTQLVSSVQSACSPQLQPVENLEKSQVSRLPGRWQVHFF